MKKYLSLLFAGLLLFACNFAPDNYSKGMGCYVSKKYEDAINYFKLTPKEDLEWLDSSKIMIGKAVSRVFESNDLVKIGTVCKIFQFDSLVKPQLISVTKKYWEKNIEKKSLFCFNLFDSVRFILTDVSGIDTLVRKTENIFFKGVWKCPGGSLQGNEIYFERNENSKLFDGKSNKTTNGWDLGKTIYKDIYYIGKNQLDHKVRVFRSSNYDYYYGYYTEPSEYFTKTKGKMSILSLDTILVNYEGSVSSNNKVLFVRQKK